MKSSPIALIVVALVLVSALAIAMIIPANIAIFVGATFVAIGALRLPTAARSVETIQASWQGRDPMTLWLRRELPPTALLFVNRWIGIAMLIAGCSAGIRGIFYGS